MGLGLPVILRAYKVTKPIPNPNPNPNPNPTALLAQLSFRRGEYAAAAAYAADALARFYPLATAWDKRRSFAHWVGFARMLHLRALRLLQGLPSLPAASTTQVGTFGASLHSIPAIVAQLP